MLKYYYEGSKQYLDIKIIVMVMYLCFRWGKFYQYNQSEWERERKIFSYIFFASCLITIACLFLFILPGKTEDKNEKVFSRLSDAWWWLIASEEKNTQKEKKQLLILIPNIIQAYKDEREREEDEKVFSRKK